MKIKLNTPGHPPPPPYAASVLLEKKMVWPILFLIPYQRFVRPPLEGVVLSLIYISQHALIGQGPLPQPCSIKKKRQGRCEELDVNRPPSSSSSPTRERLWVCISPLLFYAMSLILSLGGVNKITRKPKHILKNPMPAPKEIIHLISSSRHTQMEMAHNDYITAHLCPLIPRPRRRTYKCYNYGPGHHPLAV
jgi:hypothetical protein